MATQNLTQNQTQDETTRFTVIQDATDAEYPWVVLDFDGDEHDRFGTKADAEAEAAEQNATLAAERAEQELDELQTITQELAAVCQDPERLRKAIALLTGRA